MPFVETKTLRTLVFNSFLGPNTPGPAYREWLASANLEEVIRVGMEQEGGLAHTPDPEPLDTPDPRLRRRRR